MLFFSIFFVSKFNDLDKPFLYKLINTLRMISDLDNIYYYIYTYEFDISLKKLNIY